LLAPRRFLKLLRPSSPVAAKASTTCTWSLDHITSNILSNIFSYMTNNATTQTTFFAVKHLGR
jgi:Na+/H+-dicarboxylate symporter